MNTMRFITLPLGLAITLSCLITSCTSSAKSRYFGQTVAPSDNVLRYITGSEPESLDPPVSNSQPDARIYMALFDGLVEYDPKTMEAIPSSRSAERTGILRPIVHGPASSISLRDWTLILVPCRRSTRGPAKKSGHSS